MLGLKLNHVSKRGPCGSARNDAVTQMMMLTHLPLGQNGSKITGDKSIY